MASEIRVRELYLVGVILGGLAAMIPSLWVYGWLVTALKVRGLLLPGWLNALLGLAFASAGFAGLTRLAVTRLRRRFPDSRGRRIPDPGEVDYRIRWDC